MSMFFSNPGPSTKILALSLFCEGALIGNFLSIYILGKKYFSQTFWLKAVFHVYQIRQKFSFYSSYIPHKQFTQLAYSEIAEMKTLSIREDNSCVSSPTTRVFSSLVFSGKYRWES